MTIASEVLDFPLTTGIGSLPHHNVDAALEYSFRHDVPYLPQIPIRNPWEFMIAHALEGLPGLEVEKDGTTVLDFTVWAGRAKTFGDKLLRAFENSKKPEAFELFEPTSASSSSWQPFLWELSEKHVKIAKVQIAGPMTCKWLLKSRHDETKAGSTSQNVTEDMLKNQIMRLILAKSLAMCRRLQQEGVKPILFFDEPALYAFEKSEPRHILALQELKIMVQTLQKEGFLIGLHCCANTAWEQVLSLGLNFLAVDTALSLSLILKNKVSFQQYIKAGGRISFGIVPTTQIEHYETLNPQKLFLETIQNLISELPISEQEARKMVANSLLTPACGLALRTPAEAEIILGKLVEIKKIALNLNA